MSRVIKHRRRRLSSDSGGAGFDVLLRKFIHTGTGDLFVKLLFRAHFLQFRPFILVVRNVFKYLDIWVQFGRNSTTLRKTLRKRCFTPVFREAMVSWLSHGGFDFINDNTFRRAKLNSSCQFCFHYVKYINVSVMKQIKQYFDLKKVDKYYENTWFKVIKRTLQTCY